VFGENHSQSVKNGISAAEERMKAIVDEISYKIYFYSK